MPTYVGIDLGTTNSVVAARNAYGRPEVIANREGRNITPSVVYFGSKPPAVGDEAKEWARLGNDEIASFFKPHMGSPLYKLQFHGRDYDATDLSALVLARLKEDAEAKLGSKVDHAVITVPAYFADAQRKATIDAGRLAGLNVARIINEPTAAALAYGLQKSGVEETVLIYDLGGGTFDVTVARIAPDEVTVLSTTGDHDLGGKNWDDLIATYLAEKFAHDTGLDPLDDPVALNEVLTLAEQAKWSLSDRTSTRITLQIGQKRQSYELTRSEFEAMTFALMDRTRRLTEEALEEAGLTWKGLAGVLLVGGSTRMPMVRSYVKEMAGQDPRAGVNVDEVVALGAAIQASIEAGESSRDARPQFTLAGARRVVDVMSHSLGAVAVSPDGSSYVNDVIIRRNLAIPVEDGKTYLHETHGGRNETLEIYLTQGESTRPLDCTVLGKYVFSGIQATDSEVRVDVKMSYDINGVVQVRAIQRDTGHILKMKVEPVPDDLSWLGLPPTFESTQTAADPTRIYLLIDVSASMAGVPLVEAHQAARAFLDKCDFTTTEVGLISFSDEVTLQAEATDNIRKVQAALARLEPEGTTNLSDAIGLARQKLNRLDRTRYIVLLTDGYPDAAESAVEEAAKARGEGIEIVAIGMGDADLAYLRRLASTEEGSIFARQGELVGTFGHIAKIIAEGGRTLREAVMSTALVPKVRSANLRQAYDLALAGAIGAVCGLYLYVELVHTEAIWYRDALAGLAIGGTIGFFLNASSPFRDGAWLKLARDATWGALAGAVGGSMGLVVGEVVLGSFQGGLVGRAVSWAILGIGIGVSQGLASRSVQRLVYGLIGGTIGGFLGGFLFEAMRTGMGDRYDLGQGLGIVMLGAGLGLWLALVEQVLRKAWVQVLRGRQEGRAYLLAGKKSALGLDERAEVGLFGDPFVSRQHAEITVDGRDYVLRSFAPSGRTKVNGEILAGTRVLLDGDRIELGQTLLLFRRR